jgi:hypothetical protein
MKRGGRDRIWLREGTNEWIMVEESFLFGEDDRRLPKRVSQLAWLHQNSHKHEHGMGSIG